MSAEETPMAPEQPAFDREKAEGLAQALEDRFDMSGEDAREIARVVVEQFGGQDEVNDEALDPSVRSIFYTLESKKILAFRREEYTWETGERRRGFWWRIRSEEIQKVATLVPGAPEEDVYAALPRSVWSSRQHA